MRIQMELSDSYVKVHKEKIVVEGKANIMAGRNIPEKTKFQLVARAAGRCEFRGCNKPLYEDELTKQKGTFSNYAHIIPYEENGPRGEESKSNRPEDIHSIDNLMLLCWEHHKMVDDNPASYPVSTLHEFKREHEDRIRLTTSIMPSAKAFIVRYAVDIKHGATDVSEESVKPALLPYYYPAQSDVIDLSPELFESSHTVQWYKMAVKDLRRKYNESIRTRIKKDRMARFAIFSIAPMPLLIQLGALLNDTTNVIAYQKQRDSGWEWKPNAPDRFFQITRPTEVQGKQPVILLMLTAEIDDSLVKQVLGEAVAIWKITSDYHGYDCISKWEHLLEFKAETRTVLDDVLRCYTKGEPVHVFPIMPVSACIEFGRIRTAAHNPWVIYDKTSDKKSYTKTITIQ